MAGFLFVLFAVLQAVSPLLALTMRNVYCQPTTMVVPVDEEHSRYFPYFVNLSRCAGSWSNIDPRITRCSVKQFEEIKLYVISIATGKGKHVTVVNHTKCGPECVSSPSECDMRVERWDEASCKCSCLYQNGPPPNDVIEKKERFRWNNHLCKYVCNKPIQICGRKKTWSDETCSCGCNSYSKSICDSENRFLDPQTCECVGDNYVKKARPGFFSYPHSHEVVALLVLQGVVIVGLILAVVYYRRKGRSTVGDQ